MVININIWSSIVRSKNNRIKPVKEAQRKKHNQSSNLKTLKGQIGQPMGVTVM